MGEVTATLSLSASDPAELGRMFQAIGRALEALGPAPEAATQAEPQTPAADAASWYRANGGRFRDELKPTAQRVLDFIVEHGPLVPMAAVAEEVDLSGSQLAGSLASVGAAVRRLGAPEPPYRSDHKRHQYEIQPEVQNALKGSR